MDFNKQRTVAFAGDSDISFLNTDRNLENVIRTELGYIIEDLYHDGKNTFLCGTNTGFEALAREELKKFGERYADMSIVLQGEDYAGIMAENASELIVYNDKKDARTMEIVRCAEKHGAEILNLYDELRSYLLNASWTKRMLQPYSHATSFSYGRDGIIFKKENRTWVVDFETIKDISYTGTSLIFFLTDKTLIEASLTDGSFTVKRPTRI